MREHRSARRTNDAATSRRASAAIRLTALDSVKRGMICYHNGLLADSVGYAWVAGITSPMTEVLREALHELWVADLIDIETRNLFAPRGHRVTITAKGQQALRWSPLSDHGGHAA